MTEPIEEIGTQHVFQGQSEQALRIAEARKNCNDIYGEIIFDTNATAISISTELWCPPIWDGILCWGKTLAGDTAYQQCPSYIAGFDRLKEKAFKICQEDGQWFYHSDLKKQWTNYSQCFSSAVATVVVDFTRPPNASFYTEYMPILKTIPRIGYSISLVSLLIAFFILLCIKKLHCARNTLHMHLFTSFILKAFMFFLKDMLFVGGLGLLSDIKNQNGDVYFVEQVNTKNWDCKLVISLWQYFIVANYSWIFVEGLYLHNLVFLALFTDGSSNIGWYIAMGWGLPLVDTVAWVISRILLDDTFCWTAHNEANLFMIISIPITITIVINFILFINITRVLYIKISSSISEETQRYRRWARSTLVLVPLFGVPYTLFRVIHYIDNNPTVQLVWLICDQLFASFQGFFVALLYVFVNGEVRSELGHIWVNFKYVISEWNKTFQPSDDRGVYENACRCKFSCCSYHDDNSTERFDPVRASVCTSMSCSSLCNTMSLSAGGPINKYRKNNRWNFLCFKKTSPVIEERRRRGRSAKLSTSWPEPQWQRPGNRIGRSTREMRNCASVCSRYTENSQLSYCSTTSIHTLDLNGYFDKEHEKLSKSDPQLGMEMISMLPQP